MRQQRQVTFLENNNTIVMMIMMMICLNYEQVNYYYFIIYIYIKYITSRYDSLEKERDTYIVEMMGTELQQGTSSTQSYYYVCTYLSKILKHNNVIANNKQKLILKQIDIKYYIRYISHVCSTNVMYISIMC